MRNMPCKNHAISFISTQDPTLVGMTRHGAKPRRCKKCKWWVVTPKTPEPKKGSIRDMLKRLARRRK